MSSANLKNYIYLDNNATTRVCDEAKKVMSDWIQSCSNPSGSSWLSNASKELIAKAYKMVNALNNTKDEYYTIFTSGASESNCTLIHMVYDAWTRKVGTKPHFISSAVEHKSILECLQQLWDQDKIEMTLIQPDMYGVINPATVEAAIQTNTALVTIMFANNELGSINQIRKIGQIAHAHNIPFHTDAVQIYGKIKIDIPAFNIDALSMSFHKIYGPPGVGMLILKKAFVEGWGIKGQIAGTQQFGLRGGTENVPGIAGGIVSLVQNFKNRDHKNSNLKRMRETIIAEFAKAYPILPYSEFYDADSINGESEYDADVDTELEGGSKIKKQESKSIKRGKAIVIMGPPKEQKNSYLPSTLLISVVDFDKDFCNVKFKKMLEANGIIVSIGSACNTTSKKASHVLEAVKAPPIIKRGILRISIGDFNTISEIKRFCKTFLKLVASM